jgi:mRNA interferase MazF
MVISQGDVCWADLREPTGSEPGFRRPVVILQGDPLNRSLLATAVCIPLTSNLRLAAAPGNVLLNGSSTGLRKDSVANVSQIVTIDRSALRDRVGRLSKPQLALIFAGLDVVLDRPSLRG